MSKKLRNAHYTGCQLQSSLDQAYKLEFLKKIRQTNSKLSVLATVFVACTGILKGTNKYKFKKKTSILWQNQKLELPEIGQSVSLL